MKNKLSNNFVVLFVLTSPLTTKQTLKILLIKIKLLWTLF